MPASVLAVGVAVVDAPRTTSLSVRRCGVSVPLVIAAVAALYPFHFEINQLNLSAGDPLVGVSALVFIWHVLTRHKPWPRYTTHALVLLLVIFISLAINSVVPTRYFSIETGVVEIGKFLGVAVWMLVVFWLLVDDFPHRFLSLALFSVPIAVAFSIQAISQTVGASTDTRPVGPFENANIYANYLCLNVFLALAAHDMFVHRTDSMREGYRRGLDKTAPLLLTVTLALLLLGVLSTGSRGALVGVVAGLVLCGRWSPRRLTLRAVAALVLGLMALAAAGQWYLTHDPLVMRRIASSLSGVGPNVDTRLDLWEAARDAFYAYPVFGLGYGQFPEYGGVSHARMYLPTHQTYLSMAAELGLFGLIAYVWLLGSVVRDTLRLRVASTQIVGASLRGFLLTTAVQGLFANVDQFRSLWIAIGAMAALQLHDRQATLQAWMSEAPRPSRPARDFVF